MINKKLIHSYYFLLTAVTMTMVIFTVYTGSQAVSYGRTVSQLEKQKQVYISQQLTLQQEMSSVASLSSAQEVAQANGYLPTSQLLQLPTSTQVALR